MHTYYVTVLLNDLPEILTIDAEDFESACQSAFASYDKNVLDVTIAPSPEDFESLTDAELLNIELPF